MRPDELAALTKPLEPVAKCVPKKQLKEKVSAPRTHAMASQRSGACTDFKIHLDMRLFVFRPGASAKVDLTL